MGQPGDSSILMSDGQFKRIDELRIGDRVLSPQKNKSSIEEITNITTKLSKTVEIKSTKDKNFNCSTDHILYVLKYIRRRFNGTSKYELYYA